MCKQGLSDLYLAIIMKVPLIPLLCCICVVLLATLQRPTRGEELFIDEEVTKEKIIDERENESYMDGEDSILENFDDVLEAENICSRYSPKEVFHTVINPYLFKILDEMSIFVEAVLHRVEAALYTLLPHVDQSPIGKLTIEELFLEVRTLMFGTMKEVYDGVRQAWRELIIAYIHKSSLLHHTLAALANVTEAHNKGEEKLVASLQEVSVILKAIVFNSIYVIETSLQIPNNTDDHEAALAINRELPKIAPNFLGTMIYKVLKQGSDTSAYEKALTNPLRSIIPLIEKMHAELKAIIDRKGGIGERENEGEAEEEEEKEAMKAFWKVAVEASHLHLEEWPLLDEDFQLIYSNEEYLSEVLLQLMTTF